MVQSARGKWLLMGAVMTSLSCCFSAAWCGVTPLQLGETSSTRTRSVVTPSSSMSFATCVHPAPSVAAIVGAALAVSGTLMQAITRNPLVGPSLSE